MTDGVCSALGPPQRGRSSDLALSLQGAAGSSSPLNVQERQLDAGALGLVLRPLSEFFFSAVRLMLTDNLERGFYHDGHGELTFTDRGLTPSAAHSPRKIGDRDNLATGYLRHADHATQLNAQLRS